MKHVRELLPDVQSKRPEVSAALAAVVDNATAKRQEDRYADDAELIADLEDVLAIETARAGSATGEATTVLRTLPSSAQRRVPFRVRHRGVALLLALVVLAAGGGAAAWLATRAHHGTGKLAQQAPPAAPKQVTPRSAHGFNPLGDPKDEHPNPGLAIDNQPNTAWATQHYINATLGKAGTGLYIDASPGTTARVLRILTVGPGWSATIYARNSSPPLTWPDPGWVQISAPTTVGARQDIPLSSGPTRYRYFLVWITALGGHPSVSLNEITLYK
jgi:serine/threonine-protein kinase